MDKLYTAAETADGIKAVVNVTERLQTYNTMMSGHISAEILYIVTAIHNNEQPQKIDRNAVAQSEKFFKMLNELDFETEEDMAQLYDQIFLSDEVVHAFGTYFRSM